MGRKRVLSRGIEKILGDEDEIEGALKLAERGGKHFLGLNNKSDHLERLGARFKDSNIRFGVNGGWGGVGRAAVKGAVIGGGTEGSIEYMSGGSFWEGAKGGAMKGAMVGGGMRTAKQRTGAQTYFGEQGIRSTAAGQREKYGAGVRSLLRNQTHVKKTEEWMRQKGRDTFK